MYPVFLFLPSLIMITASNLCQTFHINPRSATDYDKALLMVYIKLSIPVHGSTFLPSLHICIRWSFLFFFYFKYHRQRQPRSSYLSLIDWSLLLHDKVEYHSNPLNDILMKYSVEYMGEIYQF